MLNLLEDLGRDPLVLTAPTSEAKRVIRPLEVEPRVELLLAPVSFPDSNRGHQLDELVRHHALNDRFRDVVVVADPTTSTLLLRVLAPDQLASGGPITLVGLPRGDRPVAVRRALATGLVLGAASGLVGSLVPVLALPGVVALLGLSLLPAQRWRHLGRELLLSGAVAVATVFLLVAGSARFPGAW